MFLICNIYSSALQHTYIEPSESETAFHEVPLGHPVTLLSPRMKVADTRQSTMPLRDSIREPASSWRGAAMLHSLPLPSPTECSTDGQVSLY